MLLRDQSDSAQSEGVRGPSGKPIGHHQADSDLLLHLLEQSSTGSLPSWQDWRPNRSESFRLIRVPTITRSEYDPHQPATAPWLLCAEEREAKHACPSVMDKFFAPPQRASQPDTEPHLR